MRKVLAIFFVGSCAALAQIEPQPLPSSYSGTSLMTSSIVSPIPVITNGGTPGVSQWSYGVKYCLADGTCTDGLGGSVSGSYGAKTTTGASTINSTNYNIITWPAPPFGVTTIKVYRTITGGTPSSKGLIATLNSSVTSFNDTGVVADGSTIPGILVPNTTGSINAAGQITSTMPACNGSQLQLCGPNMVITKGLQSISALDITEGDQHLPLVRMYTPGRNLATLPPQLYINEGVDLFMETGIVISGHATGTNINDPASNGAMISCWADVHYCIFSEPNLTGDINYQALDHSGNYVFTVEETGNLSWGNTTTQAAEDTGLQRTQAGILAVTNRSTGFSGFQTTPVAVASLPTCVAGLAGTFAAVTDANATTFNSTVAGGGANKMPVYCTGSAWTIH